MRQRTVTSPRQDAATVSEWGLEILERLLAVDSQSDADSASVPSTAGQGELSDLVERMCRSWGLPCAKDPSGNLIVTIAAGEGARAAPKIALMTHLDTSRGTRPVSALGRIRAWSGAKVPYPRNPDLTVTAAGYPSLAWALGEELLHGPGDYPIGLDNKLGMAEVLTLARLLTENDRIPRGEIVLVFRPDEEIGRMEAVAGLAGRLAGMGVRCGYTIDGIVPFEVNMENFDASSGKVRFAREPLRLPRAKLARRVAIHLTGVAAHGAVAKEEGYLNATVIAARALVGARAGEVIEDFSSESDKETNASVSVILLGDSETELDSRQRALVAALEREIGPHEWKGARLAIAGSESIDPPDEICGAATRLFEHLREFLAGDGPRPVLAEESEGFEGYTNPHLVSGEAGSLTLSYRIRAFSKNELEERESHLRRIAGDLDVEIARQYVNMSPYLAPYPFLFEWASEAAECVGRSALRRPIRGGTGVDPFLERGIPIANLGTGYFAPESEKELTTVQNIGRHVLWLGALVQVVAGQVDG